MFLNFTVDLLYWSLESPFGVIKEFFCLPVHGLEGLIGAVSIVDRLSLTIVLMLLLSSRETSRFSSILQKGFAIVIDKESILNYTLYKAIIRYFTFFIMVYLFIYYLYLTCKKLPGLGIIDRGSAIGPTRRRRSLGRPSVPTVCYRTRFPDPCLQ